MPIKNLNAGKTFPKKGRLGSGAYWPKGVPIPGNIFGPNAYVQTTPAPPTPRHFGAPSNAGNNTQFGQSRVTTGQEMVHPNAGSYSRTVAAKIPAMMINGATQTFENPRSANPVIQPHERNTLHSRKVFGAHRMAMGAGRVMPVDTAFKRVPPAQLPQPPATPQNNTTAIVRAQHPPSFMTRNNLWFDPNNSFLQGKTNVHGDVGRARWNTIKRGAAG